MDERQKNIMFGILMGDGCIYPTTSGKARFSLSVCEEDFMQWVNDIFGVFTYGVCSIDEGPDRWRTRYSMETRSLPELMEYRENWYPGEEKVFPEDISINKTTISMWYVCDGGISVDSRWDSKRSYIGCSNESKHKEKIISYFDDTPFNPYWGGDQQIWIPAGETEEFLEWIEGPIPGYEYKWS